MKRNASKKVMSSEMHGKRQASNLHLRKGSAQPGHVKQNNFASSFNARSPDQLNINMTPNPKNAYNNSTPLSINKFSPELMKMPEPIFFPVSLLYLKYTRQR